MYAIDFPLNLLPNMGFRLWLKFNNVKVGSPGKNTHLFAQFRAASLGFFLSHIVPKHQPGKDQESVVLSITRLEYKTEVWCPT